MHICPHPYGIARDERGWLRLRVPRVGNHTKPRRSLINGLPATSSWLYIINNRLRRLTDPWPIVCRTASATKKCTCLLVSWDTSCTRSAPFSPTVVFPVWSIFILCRGVCMCAGDPSMALICHVTYYYSSFQRTWLCNAPPPVSSGKQQEKRICVCVCVCVRARARVCERERERRRRRKREREGWKERERERQEFVYSLLTVQLLGIFSASLSS